MPSISVIVPNYNREALIGQTLRNLLAQTRPPDELIVVDDGSTDGSADVIAGFGKAVTLIRQPNRGPGPARNRGLAAASGDFIQFFDSDDLCSLNKLEAQARLLEAGDGDFVYSPWLQARLEGGEALHCEPVLQQRGLPASRSPLSWYLRGWVIVFQCCLFRRSLLEAVGPYREDLMPTEDSELLFRMLAAGARPRFAADALTVYRLHGGHQISQGGMMPQRRARDWFEYVRVVGAQLRAAPQVTPADRRRWAATEHAAARQLVKSGAPLPAGYQLPSQPIHRAATSLAAQARRVIRRLGGPAFARPFQPGALTQAQREQLRELGYEPRMVSRRALSGR